MGRLYRLAMLGLVCLFLAEWTAWRIDQRLRAAPVGARRQVTTRKQQQQSVGWKKPAPFDPKTDFEVPVGGADGGYGTADGGSRTADGGEVAPDAQPGRIRRRSPRVPLESVVPDQPSSPPSPIAPPPSEGAQRLSRTELQELFLSSDEWAEGLTLKRARQGDRILGIYINYQGADNPLPRLGIQPGDILTGLNGHPLESQDDYRWAGHQLREGTRFDVQVLRGGAPLTLSFEIEDDKTR